MATCFVGRKGEEKGSVEESLLHLIALAVCLGSAVSCQLIPDGHGSCGHFCTSPAICLSCAPLQLPVAAG